MKAHMSRLEKDRAAVAAKKAAGVSSPAVDSRLPSYMRQTAASAAMQKVSLSTHLVMEVDGHALGMRRVHPSCISAGYQIMLIEQFIVAAALANDIDS